MEGILGAEGTTPGKPRATGTPGREGTLGIEGMAGRDARGMLTGAAAVKDAKATVADTTRARKEGICLKGVWVLLRIAKNYAMRVDKEVNEGTASMVHWLLWDSQRNGDCKKKRKNRDAKLQSSNDCPDLNVVLF